MSIQENTVDSDEIICHIEGCNREAQVRCVNCGEYVCSLHAQHDVTMKRGAFGAPGKDKHFSTICDECVPKVRAKMKTEAKTGWVVATIIILMACVCFCGFLYSVGLLFTSGG